MRKGELTREHILEQAAGLFNQQGFAGASLSDIMDATGLQKGGIYRHFESKEALAVEAFDFAVQRMSERFAEVVSGKESALERLRGIIGVFAELPTNPPVPGGCPIMNAAIENDDGNPLLRQRAREAMNGLQALIHRTVERGIARGELRADLDAEELATVMTATLEGAVMLSRLYDDPTHVARAADHLLRYLKQDARA